MAHNTIFNVEILDTDKEFTYQIDLTSQLDNIKVDFNQSIINEIVLWKVNRYACIDKETLTLLNNIKSNSQSMDEDKTREILKRLLNTKGVRLPMASTILRFRNKYIYQIIDQRVYRMIYRNKNLKLKQHLNDLNMNTNIEIYLKYLEDLKKVCNEKNIQFELADRILYMADKRINKGDKLEY